MSDQTTARVLLVEDNVGDELLAIRALKEAEVRMDMTVVRDGVEAVEYLFGTANGDPAAGERHMVLLDLKLPRMSGFEVLRRIRADARTRYVPVVVLTTSDEERDLIQSYDLGANGYVRKPVDLNEFRDAVRLLARYWLLINCTPTPSVDTTAATQDDSR